MKIEHVYHISIIMCCMDWCVPIRNLNTSMFIMHWHLVQLWCISEVHMFKVNWRKPKIVTFLYGTAQHNTMRVLLSKMYIVHAYTHNTSIINCVRRQRQNSISIWFYPFLRSPLLPFHSFFSFFSVLHHDARHHPFFPDIIHSTACSFFPIHLLLSCLFTYCSA